MTFFLFLVLTIAILFVAIWFSYRLEPYHTQEWWRFRAAMHKLRFYPMRLEQLLINISGWCSFKALQFFANNEEARTEKLARKISKRLSRLERYYQNQLGEAWREQQAGPNPIHPPIPPQDGG